MNGKNDTDVRSASASSTVEVEVHSAPAAVSHTLLPSAAVLFVYRFALFPLSAARTLRFAAECLPRVCVARIRSDTNVKQVSKAPSTAARITQLLSYGRRRCLMKLSSIHSVRLPLPLRPASRGNLARTDKLNERTLYGEASARTRPALSPRCQFPILLLASC